VEISNGWNRTRGTCGGETSSAAVPIARYGVVLSGFFYAVQITACLDAGVYGSADFWSSTFGCVECRSGDPGNVPQSVFEWAYGN
ncbi:MAG: hypothetical protein M1115_06895, partial [Actinobacteria bacterium]|nr:hypothetical protein [Actinomycetota bacterium]